MQFRIDTSHKLSFHSPPPADHGVGLMALGPADRSEVDLEAQTLLIGVQHKGSDVVTDVENQRFCSIARPDIDKGRFVRASGHLSPSCQ